MKKKLPSVPRASANPRCGALAVTAGSGACAICGKSPANRSIFTGVLSAAACVCSDDCADTYHARNPVKKRTKVTGFPGHNAGKKYVRGVGYVWPSNERYRDAEWAGPIELPIDP